MTRAAVAFPPPGFAEDVVAAVEQALGAEVINWMAIVDPDSEIDLTINADLDGQTGNADVLLASVEAVLARAFGQSGFRVAGRLKPTGYIEIRLQLDDGGFPVLRMALPHDWPEAARSTIAGGRRDV